MTDDDTKDRVIHLAAEATRRAGAVSIMDITPQLVTGSDAEVAEQLAAQYAAADGAEPIAYNGEVYRYDRARGVWSICKKAALKADLRVFDGAAYGEKGCWKLAKGKADSVLDLLRAFTDSDVFDDAKYMLVLEDVALEVDPQTWTLRERGLTPELYQRHALPVAYDPQATAPKTMAALARLFNADEIATLQVWAGAAVFGLGPELAKALLIQGGPGTGKSTVLELLSQLMPAGSVSHVKPHDFSHRFRPHALNGALLNVCNELPREELRNWHALKTVVSCEGMQLEPKGRDAYNFRPRAAHLFSCNHFPQVADATTDFWDRWIVLQTHAKPVRGTGAERRGYAAELVKEEIAGIVVWLVEGARRFAEVEGRIKPCATSIASLHQWRGVADTVAMFFDAACREDLATAETSPDLPALSFVYGRYKAWCRDHGHQDPTPQARVREWFADRHLVAQTSRNTVKLRISLLDRAHQ